MPHDYPIGFEWSFDSGKNVVSLVLLIEHKILNQDEFRIIGPIELCLDIGGWESCDKLKVPCPSTNRPPKWVMSEN